MIGTCCRGGPPWPPGVRLDLFAITMASCIGLAVIVHRVAKRSTSTPGGHGGPPLQWPKFDFEKAKWI